MTQMDGKTYTILGLEESILLKWLYYSRPFIVNAIPIKLPVGFFTELEQKF